MKTISTIMLGFLILFVVTLGVYSSSEVPITEEENQDIVVVGNIAFTPFGVFAQDPITKIVTKISKPIGEGE